MSGKFWPCLVVGFLAMNVAIVAITISAAHRDGGPVLVSQVEDRSMRWDQWRAAAARSDALGWMVKVDVVPAERQTGTVTIRINDAKGPVVGAVLNVSVLHDAHPGKVESFVCSTDDYGVAVGHHQLTQLGNYTVRVQSAGVRDRSAFAKEISVRSSLPQIMEKQVK